MNSQTRFSTGPLVCLLLVAACSRAPEHSPEQVQAAQRDEIESLKSSLVNLKKFAATAQNFKPKPNTEEPPVFIKHLKAAAGNTEGYYNRYGQPKDVLQELVTLLKGILESAPTAPSPELNTKLDQVKVLAEKLQ